MVWHNKLKQKKAFKKIYKQRINDFNMTFNSGIGACCKMRKKEWNQLLLIRLGKGKIDENAFRSR